jgi:hypothetical protein
MNGMDKIVIGIEFFERWQGAGDGNVSPEVVPVSGKLSAMRYSDAEIYYIDAGMCGTHQSRWKSRRQIK